MLRVNLRNCFWWNFHLWLEHFLRTMKTMQDSSFLFFVFLLSDFLKVQQYISWRTVGGEEIIFLSSIFFRLFWIEIHWAIAGRLCIAARCDTVVSGSERFRKWMWRGIKTLTLALGSGSWEQNKILKIFLPLFGVSWCSHFLFRFWGSYFSLK